jgi:cation/acetate symporter
MNLQGTPLSIAIFGLFVALVLFLSYFFAKKAKSAAGYYAAGGNIHWAVNGISFAGDYLSAASFLGICGMIAVLGYDGFLYSIGYLAGWIVALFVVAEPMKRMGKFTFTDALDAKFNSRGIKLMAAISTLVVSICYLIPQMNGAGSLVEPLLGLPHWVGVVIVGVIVILIVSTAGMASTTYVQFLKGGLLLIFSTVLVVFLLGRGLSTEPPSLQDDQGKSLLFVPQQSTAAQLEADGYSLDFQSGELLRYKKGEELQWWKKDGETLWQSQWESATLVNGKPDGLLMPVGRIKKIGGMDEAEAKKGTGSLGAAGFLSTLTHEDTRIEQWRKSTIFDDAGEKYTVYHPMTVSGTTQMKPGVKFKVKTFWQKLNFISLMLALFFGTAALPHILIRYYTVPSPACARKSTIVAIAAIGFFYVLTMFMGLGAATNGTINPADNNMSAPLLAMSFGGVLFAIISAIAFATVLGTVAGLIVASSGAVAHDLMDRFGGMNLSEEQKVKAGGSQRSPSASLRSSSESSSAA